MLSQISQETNDFILKHREEDVRKLALKGQPNPLVDITYALQQIDGWQRARHKLPMWAQHEGIIYPPHISMEQCSSEATAVYKQLLVRRLLGDVNDATMADLTGGFGVDFSYMSQGFATAYYIEQQQHLCDIARHNFSVLGMGNSHVFCGAAESFLENCPHLDLIYLDPARRDVNGKKTYAISDCTPDVTTLLPKLRAVADCVIVKLSPMLDHREAVRLLPGVSEIHILSVRNECKETLLVIKDDSAECKIFCVNDSNTFVSDFSVQQQVPYAQNVTSGMKLFVPNASVMKAGCFGSLCADFGLEAVSQNSNLFVQVQNGETADKCSKNADFIGNFPGRTFTIKTIASMNKRDLKTSLAGISQANLAVRNFPLSVDALKAKLKGVAKLRDGGNTYIFATTIGKQHVLLITEKY